MKKLPWVVGVALALGLGIWRLVQGVDPETILANIEIPPAPVLSPEEALASFRVAPGFRVEPVAAEPLVVDPVAMDWDDQGRLYVVEMRGYMPDIEGRGEERPVGRVVVLEDVDGDGRMDRSRSFLEGLVMPRAVAVLPEGVLISVPPDLLLCEHAEGCESPRRLGEYAAGGAGVEHNENRLLAATDGWLYNAKSTRRFRLASTGFEVEETLFRGQWGIDQDDAGRLYYNHNSGFLYVDVFPGEYALRQPTTAARIDKPGINVDLAPGAEVFGIRVAPGLNRAYQAGSLRHDGRQRIPTAVSGLAVQRGDQFGPTYRGDVFVPESAGAVVAHFSVDASGLTLTSEHRLYPDVEHEVREFLASTDERFRPVDARIGPDGALWIIDMYRGVIQHAEFVSDYLRDYVAKQGLEPPGATGRIWRVVREDRPIRYRPPPLERLEEQLLGLDHANAWVRERAQRRLIHEADAQAPARLRALETFTPTGRVHALAALAALGGLDLETLRKATRDDVASVRIAALRLGESLLSAESRAAEVLRAESLRLLADADAAVRLQAIHSLGALPVERRPLARLLAIARDGDALQREAVFSGLSGLEARALEAALADAQAPEDWLRDVATLAYYAAHRESAEAVVPLLDAAAELQGDTLLAVLEGIQRAQQLPDNRRVALAVAHPLFGEERASGASAELLGQIRRGITWPGDPRPGGARALSAEEERLRAAGAQLFAVTCRSCHGAHGAGLPGLAPPLAASPWVRDADAWLIRIVLQGVDGPIEVAGETWNLAMPGHGHDPRFSDAAVAGLLTYLRRAWGHADEPVSPETVARVRAETVSRREPWSAAELLALPVAHRLDRFTGIYGIPLVGVELALERKGATLQLGRREGGRAPLTEITDGVFSGEGLTFRFDLSKPGPVSAARVTYGGNEFPVSRVDE